MKDGGPAFPNESEYRYTDDDGNLVWGRDPGMSLRDYFAAAALTGLYANPRSIVDNSGVVGIDASWAAKGAYQAADAMLAEREAHR